MEEHVFDLVDDRLKTFLTYDDGWYYGDETAITKTAIATARCIINTLKTTADGKFEFFREYFREQREE